MTRILQRSVEGQARAAFRSTCINRDPSKVKTCGRTPSEPSDVTTETAALRRHSDAPVNAPGQSDGSNGGKAMAALRENAKEGDLTRLQRVRSIDAANLAAKARVGQWMGGGAMVVQAIGLFQAGPQLMAALKGPDGDKLREAALSVADGVSGFAGALADTSASAHKAMLLENSAGRQMVALSTRLVMLETAAAVAGMAGGALNAVMMGYKGGEAWRQRDVASSISYYSAAIAFGGTGVTSALTAANTVTGGLIGRAIARRILLRGIAVISAQMLAESAAVVVAGLATAGWVLLVVGVGSMVYATLTTRSELQRWAARCWFGVDSDAERPGYSTAADEDAALDSLLMPVGRLDASHVFA